MEAATASNASRMGEEPGADPSGEQLAIALQCLHAQLKPAAQETSMDLKAASTLDHLPSFPRLDWTQIDQGRKLLGGLAGGRGLKTQLEKDIHLATSKVCTRLFCHAQLL